MCPLNRDDYTVDKDEAPAQKSNGSDHSDDDGHQGRSRVEGVTIEDFHAYMPSHSYIFSPTGEMWPASSVNSRLPSVTIGDKRINASAWLDRNKPVEQMTWAPGEPKLIPNRLIKEGGWIERNGVMTINLYRAPTIQQGDATKAGRWLDHIRKVYADDADHIVKWLAHRVQHPEVKINHALMLGGAPGIGKDTLLEPIKHVIGPWNFIEVSPTQMLGRFNGFVKSVILRVSEVRDLGDLDRYALYEHLKVYAAAPPDVLRVDEKNLREHAVLNCTGLVITTNHKLDGIYLPGDDRRHFVAWSDLTKADFEENYWNELYRWYEDGGIGDVAAYLARLDLTDFDAKAPPPKTEAFWAIANANHAPEDSELADILDRLGNPDALTLLQIADRADRDFGMWLRDRKNRRLVGYRFETCGYVAVRNEGAKDGLWKISDRRQVIYAKASLSVRERYLAAQRLVGKIQLGAGGRIDA
jgi:hypothetical protein